LEKLGKSKRATRKYTDFFIVNQEKTENFSFAPDNDKIDERLSRAGFFILLSNDEGLDSGNVLRIYRGKDVIEKNFDQLKNGLDFKRLRTHVNQTTDGKVFIGFLALILRSYLISKIKDNPDIKHITLEKALIEFRKIKAITFEDLSRMLMPLTKLQRTILEAIGVSPSKLQDSFS
jgi:transposase